MSAPLSFAELKQAVAAGRVDTVVACMVDMQGRLIGKRFQAEFFVDSAHEETHGCNYLLADDIDMEPVPGYAAASWARAASAAAFTALPVVNVPRWENAPQSKGVMSESPPTMRTSSGSTP